MEGNKAVRHQDRTSALCSATRLFLQGHTASYLPYLNVLKVLYFIITKKCRFFMSLPEYSKVYGYPGSRPRYALV